MAERQRVLFCLLLKKGETVPRNVTFSKVDLVRTITHGKSGHDYSQSDTYTDGAVSFQQCVMPVKSSKFPFGATSAKLQGHSLTCIHTRTATKLSCTPKLVTTSA